MSHRRPKPAGRAARKAANAALDLRHEDARTTTMLDGLQPEILRLAPEAVACASSHVLFAGDPRCEFLTSDLDGARLDRLHSALGVEPVVGFLPADVAEGLIERFAEIQPSASGLLRNFRSPLAPQSFRLLTICGRAMGLKVLTVGARAPEPSEAMLLTVRGVLKVTYLSDPADIRPGPSRERIRRFKERVDAAMAAESIKVRPRTLDEVLWSDFDGQGLERDMAARGPDGVQMWLERMTKGAVS